MSSKFCMRSWKIGKKHGWKKHHKKLLIIQKNSPDYSKKNIPKNFF